MGVVGEREDVVGAQLVGAVPPLLLVDVEGGRRVEGVDAAVEVDIVDELVEVAVPLVGLRAEYANLRAGRRYCAAYSEHRANTTETNPVSTAECVSSRALVGRHEHVFRF